MVTENIDSKCDFCEKFFSKEDELPNHIIADHRSIVEGQKTPFGTDKNFPNDERKRAFHCN